MEKRFFAFVAVLLVSNLSFGQTELNTDRPGQSINPLTTPKNTVLLQSGYSYLNESDLPLVTEGRDFHGADLQVRYGILGWLEASVGSAFDIDNNSEDNSGFTALILSARSRIINTDLISVGLEGSYLREGVAGRSLESESGRFILTASSAWSERFSTTSNVIYRTDDQFAFTINQGFSISDEGGIFVEYFPNYDARDGLAFDEAFLNLGGYFLINQTLQLDLTGGAKILGADSDSDIFYFQAGISKVFDLR